MCKRGGKETEGATQKERDSNLSISSLGHWPVGASLRGAMTLYMVAVKHIYSVPIYLTATKACRLTGLPAETLNEELEPVCMVVFVRARTSVLVYKCVFLGVFVKALTEL